MDDDVRVMVVDDSADAADALAEYLRQAGYVVETSTDSLAALALIQQTSPHCVLLDVNMPKMDGLELARHIRAQFADDVVLIAVTGFAADSERVKATFGVVDHHFQKPVDYGALCKVLPPLR